jgi:hypothetical protein
VLVLVNLGLPIVVHENEVAIGDDAALFVQSFAVPQGDGVLHLIRYCPKLTFQHPVFQCQIRQPAYGPLNRQSHIYHSEVMPELIPARLPQPTPALLPKAIVQQAKLRLIHGARRLNINATPTREP